MNIHRCIDCLGDLKDKMPDLPQEMINSYNKEGRLIYCPVLLRNGLGPHHAAIYFKDVFDTLIKLCPYGLELALEGK
jgi:hypothetical protein